MIKRYLCQAVLLLVAGILTAKGMILYQDENLPGYGIFLAALAVLAAAVSAAVWIWREPSWRRKLRKAYILSLAFTAGAVRMSAVSSVMEHRLEGLTDGQKVAVQGRIAEKKYQVTQDQEIQWTVCLTDSYLKTSREICSCGNIIIYLNQKTGEPVIGNTILFNGNIKLFREARNDGNFDERAYYQNQGCSLKIYADEDSVQVKDLYRDRLREFLYRVQQKLMQVYQKTMPQQEAGALSAMLLGDKSLLLGQTKDLYRQSGIAHILAISGLHISILGAAVFRLLRKCGISYAAASAVSMGLLAAFGMMTGMGISTVRAVVMFGIYLGAACCGRAYDSMNGLAAAAVCILLKNPRALFLAGFQFSFAAVAGVLLGKEICRIYRPKYRLAETVLVSLSIQVLTLPLTAWYYYEIPVYSVLLNLFVLPLMGLVLVLGLLGGMAGLGICTAGQFFAEGMLWVCTLILGYFSKAGELFLKLPGAVYVTGQPAWQQMACYYLLLAGFVWGNAKFREYSEKKLQSRDRQRTKEKISGKQTGTMQRPEKQQGSRCLEGKQPGSRCREKNRPGGACPEEKQWERKPLERMQWTEKQWENMVRRIQKSSAAVCFSVCMCILFLNLPKPAEAVILDVGQGDGIYIRTSDGMDVFVDGGSSDVRQAGTYRILPFLKSQGVSGIDYWFVSHLDQDHISGLKEALDSGYRIGQVIFAEGVLKDEAYDRLLAQLSESEICAGYLGKGDVLHGKNASFKALAPDSAAAENDRNAGSLVLLYEDCGFTGFFPGDISEKEERKLLDDGCFEMDRIVLYKAAHHGSGYSNSKELLERLKPAVSAVSCAQDNDYGHPGKEAVEHMEMCGSRVYYTMQSGQIRVRWDEDGLEVMEKKKGR